MAQAKIARHARVRELGISITDYGASLSLGSTALRAAIQSAVDAAADEGISRVLIPGVDTGDDEAWEIDGPILMKSFVEIVGEGKASFLKNVAASNTPYPNQCIVVPGTYHPVYFGELTYYALNASTDGARSVITTTAADAGAFTVGEMVVIRSTDHWDQVVGAETYTQPLYQQVNRVRSVNAGTGAIGLDYALDEAITGLEIARMNDPANPEHSQGVPVYGIDRAGLRNVSVWSDRQWINEGGALDCTFRDIHIRNSHGFIYGNTFAHCLFENFRGVSSNKFIEIAAGSHNNTIRTMRMSYVEDAGVVAATALPVLQLAEQCRDNLIEDFDVNMADWDLANDFLYIESAKRNRIRNGRVFAPNATQDLVHFRSDSRSPDQSSCVDNIVEDVRFKGGPAMAYLARFDQTGTGVVQRNKVRKCEFDGVSSNGFVSTTGSDNEFTGNRLSSGSIRISSTVTNFVVEDNYAPAGLAFSAATGAALFTNRVRRNDSDRARVLRALTIYSESTVTVTSTSTDHAEYSAAVPAGNLKTRDHIHFRLVGTCSGTAGAKTVAIADDDGALVTVSFLAAETGAFVIEGMIKVKAVNDYVGVFHTIKGTTVGGLRIRRAGAWSLTNDSRTFEIRAWKGDAADTLSIDSAEMWFEAPGAALSPF